MPPDRTIKHVTIDKVHVLSVLTRRRRSRAENCRTSAHHTTGAGDVPKKLVPIVKLHDSDTVRNIVRDTCKDDDASCDK
jgi:hypothetical protein